MEEISDAQTEPSIGGKAKKGFALVSLILGIISLIAFIFLMITPLEVVEVSPGSSVDIPVSAFSTTDLLFSAVLVFAIIAIICGIIALIKKERKVLSLGGILLALFPFLFFFVGFLNITGHTFLFLFVVLFILAALSSPFFFEERGRFKAVPIVLFALSAISLISYYIDINQINLSDIPILSYFSEELTLLFSVFSYLPVLILLLLAIIASSLFFVKKGKFKAVPIILWILLAVFVFIVFVMISLIQIL